MKYLILGVIQGLTEFIPVSSSGHLLIIQNLMHLNTDTLQLIVFSHLGTLLALLFYFFKEIKELLKSKKLVSYILMVNLVTGLIAIIFKKYFENLFSSIKILKFTFLINGIIILLSYFSKSNRKVDSLRLKGMFGLGVTQALAIVPGISRSGITISYLLLNRLNKKEAFEFSFLAGLPAILGAFILEAKFNSLNIIKLSHLFFCLLISFLTGLLALGILKRFIYKEKFYYFGYYCLLIGVLLFFIR
jgi:undecaprenyl-diphosphatase